MFVMRDPLFDLRRRNLIEVKAFYTQVEGAFVPENFLWVGH
jgi:hypothetical protein